MRRKNFLSLLLAFIMVMQIILQPLSVFAAGTNAGNIEYLPVRQKYAIAPGQLYMNSDFYNGYVKTNERWAFNSIAYFTDGEVNYDTENIDFSKSYSHKLSEFDPVLEALRKKGDLMVNFRVALANSPAVAESKQNGKKVYFTLGKQVAGLKYNEEGSDYDNTYRNYFGEQLDSQYHIHGDTDYFKYTSWSSGKMMLYYCVDSIFPEEANIKPYAKMKNSSLVFADNVKPKVKEIYTSADINGNTRTDIVNIESVRGVYIHVKFDENIRFSDNRAAHSNVYLKLRVNDLKNGIFISDANQKAELVRLKGDTLTFRYYVPEKINGVDTEISINGFDGIYDADKKDSKNNDSNALSSSYPLIVLTNTGELTGHYDSTGLVSYSSASLITDLSGNPVNSANLPAPKNTIFADLKRPEVKSVSLKVEGDKYGYAGAGSKITPTVTFSEPIEGNKKKIMAITNLSKNSQSIILQAEKISNDKRSIQFKSFTVDKDTKINGSNNILITEIIQNGNGDDLIADTCGNRTKYYNITIPNNIADSEYVLDTDNPVINTNMQKGEDDRYKPEPYAADGGSVKDSIRFHFNITDSKSGLMPAEGNPALNGSFKWELGSQDIDISTLSFRYAVTNSPESPNNSDINLWKSGKFNTEYLFSQIAENKNSLNQYLHMGISGLEEVNLDNSILKITGIDLVGNKGEKSFVMDASDLISLLDHTLPEISADKLYSYKDGAEKWNFAADFTLKDKSGIDTENVYYQWTENGMTPDINGWSKLTGLGASSSEIKAAVSYELTDNADNKKDLYIRVQDISINSNISESGPYSFTKNLSAPKLSIEASGDLQTKAILKIKADAQSTAVQTDDQGSVTTVSAIIVVRVKESSGYSFKTIDIGASGVDIDVLEQAEGWSFVGDGNVAKGLINSTYYGEAELDISVGYGIGCTDGDIENPYASIISSEKYVLSVACQKEKIHNIEIISSLEDLSQGWSSPEDGAKYYTGLSGISFNITVSNELKPNWNLKDFDFNKSYFELYKEGEAEPLYKAPVGMNTAVTLPDDISYENGSYRAEVSVTAKTSGKLDKKIISGIIVNNTKPAEFGLSASRIKWENIDYEASNLFRVIAEENIIDYEHDELDDVGNPTGKSIYNASPYVLLGSAQNELATSSKILQFTTRADDEFYIKLWNATEGIDKEQSKSLAKWQPISTEYSSFTALVKEQASDILSSYSLGVIPVINNTENILCYQICHANGEISGEKAFIADVREDVPELEISLTPGTDTPSDNVTAAVSNLRSSLSYDIKAYYCNELIPGSHQEAENEIDLQSKYGNWFYTYDSYGNYTILNIEAPQLDKTPPDIISADKVQGEGDGYAITVVINDENDFSLSMKFDDDYMNRLGLSNYFALNIPKESGEVWLADSGTSGGIYKIERADEDYGIMLKIYGVYMYDKNKSPLAELGCELIAHDLAGNESVITETFTDIPNKELEMNIDIGTKIEKVPYYYNYGNETVIDELRDKALYNAKASFNLPVKDVKPLQHHNAENVYALTKDFLSIFKDGIYNISYTDVFGNKHVVEREIYVPFDDMNIGVSGENEGKYNLSVLPAANEGKSFFLANEGARFTLFADKYQESLFNGPYVRSMTATSAEQSFDKNENAIIVMMKYLSNGWHLDSDRPIIIIDSSQKRTPELKVNWYYREFGSDKLPDGATQTDENVEVWISSSSPLTGINGKLLSHTFTYGEPSSYTFEYQYDDGITGFKTINLPISIVEENTEEQDNKDNYNHTNPDVPEDDLNPRPDTVAPTASFLVSGSLAGKPESKGLWDPTDAGSNLKQLLTWAGAFVLGVDIHDASATRIVLRAGENASGEDISYDNFQSDTIAGVSKNGTSINVSAAAAFTVWLVDKANNKNSYSFSEDLWEQLDSIKPELDTVSYEHPGFYEINALFKLKDNKTPADEIKLMNPIGLQRDINGNYIITFKENTSKQLIMKDLAGNIGSGEVGVTSIDTEPPNASVVWWSRGYYYDNVYIPEILTDKKTNQTIIAKVAANKTLKSVILKNVWDNNDDEVLQENWEKYVAFSHEGSEIFVDFIQNASIRLELTSLNDKKSELGFEVKNIIDKEAPVIDVELTDLNTAVKAEVTFKNFSEPVYVYGPDETGRLVENEDIIKTFTERGSYVFRFIDEAGNTVTKKIEIKNIDELSPGILLSDMPRDGDYYSDSVTFKATMSERGTLNFNGASAVTVNAPIDSNNNGEIEEDECDWRTFTVRQNGNYSITATDIAGRKTISSVQISCFDKSAPSIFFEPATIIVLSSTDLQSFEDMLKNGVTLNDNVSSPEDIDLSHEALSADQLSTPGSYKLTYTAKDKAGNIGKAVRYVRVYSADDIKVTVNGTRAGANEVTAIDSRTINLSVSKLPMGDNEPYKIYLRKGVWTAGQMKGLLAEVRTDVFSVSENGYYTLYIVTQNRGTYLTYLYVN